MANKSNKTSNARSKLVKKDNAAMQSKAVVSANVSEIIADIAIKTTDSKQSLIAFSDNTVVASDNTVVASDNVSDDCVYHGSDDNSVELKASDAPNISSQDDINGQTDISGQASISSQESIKLYYDEDGWVCGQFPLYLPIGKGVKSIEIDRAVLDTVWDIKEYHAWKVVDGGLVEVQYFLIEDMIEDMDIDKDYEVFSGNDSVVIGEWENLEELDNSKEVAIQEVQDNAINPDNYDNVDQKQVDKNFNLNQETNQETKQEKE